MIVCSPAVHRTFDVTLSSGSLLPVRDAERYLGVRDAERYLGMRQQRFSKRWSWRALNTHPKGVLVLSVVRLGVKAALRH